MDFFYSKNAVQFFFQQEIDFVLKNPTIKFATIGKATANELIKFNTRASFVGEGNSNTIADDFTKIAKKGIVLFPKALKSKSSIEQLLSHEYFDIRSVVIYENKIKSELHFKHEYDIVCFTSPLNVESFHQSYIYQNQFIPVAIGETTYLEIKKFYSDKNILICENQLESDFILLIEKIRLK